MPERLARSPLYSNIAIGIASAVVIAGIWIVAIERLRYEYRQTIVEAQHDNGNLALGLEEHTRRVVGHLDRAVLLVRHEYMREGRGMNLLPLLNDAKIELPLVTSLLVLDENGNHVSGYGKFKPDNRAEFAYFPALRDATDDPLFIGRPRFNRVTQTWTLDIARRITRPDGSFGGVAVAVLDPANLNDFHRDVDLGPEETIMLVGTDGIGRMRRTGGKITIDDDMRGSPLLEAYAKQPAGHFMTNGASESASHLMSYRKVRGLPLIVAAGSTAAETFADYHKHQRDYSVVAGVASLTVLALALALMRTLTRQRRAVDALVRNESRFRATFDQAFVGMAQSKPDGRLVQVNKTLCDILGYSDRELLGRPLADFVHPEDANAGAGARAGAPTQKRFVRKDGAIAWANTASTVVHDAAGNPDRVVDVVQDITEFKRIDRMKNEFVSTVSHELRTPLTSIRGSLGLITGGIAGPLPQAAQGLVEIAKNNCERLIRLINDILDSEKIESGKMNFDMRVVPLRPLAAQSLAANEGFAAQHQVALRLQGLDDSVRVNVDPDRLNQVLTNLVSNAVKFSPTGGTVEIDLSRAAGRVRVEVRDTGPGIPEEFRARIFQKFSQADSSDARQKGGTGLGLNISKAIVEHLGGTIGFTTETGKGSTFFFELPEAREAAGAGISSATAGERPCVLVCEDDADIARLLCMMLDKAGYDTEVAQTAGRTRERAASRDFVAITVDLKLPDQDGISLIRALRAEPRTRVVPIIVVSARAEEGRVELNNQALSVSDWLSKPIDEVRLVRAVSHALHGNGERVRVLHVEDDPDIQRVAAAIAQDLAMFEFAGSLAEARELLARWKFELVLLDLLLPDGSGWQLLPDIEALRPQPQVVVFSVADVSAADAARVAAVLVKGDTSNEELIATIRRVLRRGAA